MVYNAESRLNIVYKVQDPYASKLQLLSVSLILRQHLFNKRSRAFMLPEHALLLPVLCWCTLRLLNAI